MKRFSDGGAPSGLRLRDGRRVVEKSDKAIAWDRLEFHLVC